MRFVFLGVAFAALGFVAANAGFSLLTALAWRSLRSRPLRADTLFWLRMLPAAGSAALAVAVVAPAFWLFEPRDTHETVSPALLLFVVVAGGLVVLGIRRGIAGWLTIRRWERTWRALAVHGEPSALPVPAYSVRCDLPFAALVGVFRPRLYVSDRFLEALSRGERQMVLAHEAGHLRSRDNLKRGVIRLAPDWLALSPVAAEIEAAWAIAAEEDADDHASGRAAEGSVDLAAALLKALRLTPLPCAPAINFCEGATVARRVSRLLSDTPRPAAERRLRAASLVWAGAVSIAAVALAAPALRTAYAMTEAVVKLLQ